MAGLVVVISSVLKSRVWSVNLHLLGSILLLTKKHTLAGAFSAVVRETEVKRVCDWVVGRRDKGVPPWFLKR